jgi:hypothetical protein
MSCTWGDGSTSARQARWVILIALLIVLGEWRAFGQDTVVVKHQDGTQTTVKASCAPALSTCTVESYDSTPSLWSVLKDNRAAFKARKQAEKQCKAAGVKAKWSFKDGEWTLNQECEDLLKEAK